MPMGGRSFHWDPTWLDRDGRVYIQADDGESVISGGELPRMGIDCAYNRFHGMAVGG
jgi:hypothetical protein